jgi:rod shape-determining protein MreD
LIELVAILLATYLAAVADAAIAPALTIYHIAPTFLPLVVIFATVAATPSPWRVVQIAAAGLAFDFNVGGHAGVGMASFALMAFAIGQARTVLRHLEPLEQALACAPIVTATLLFVAIGNFAFGEAVPAAGPALVGAIATGVYTAAISLPFWMIIGWRRQSHRLRPAASHR